MGSTHEANEDIAKLYGKGMITFPKIVRLIEHLLLLVTSVDGSKLALMSDDSSGKTATSGASSIDSNQSFANRENAVEGTGQERIRLPEENVGLGKEDGGG